MKVLDDGEEAIKELIRNGLLEEDPNDPDKVRVPERLMKAKWINLDTGGSFIPNEITKSHP